MFDLLWFVVEGIIALVSAAKGEAPVFDQTTAEPRQPPSPARLPSARVIRGATGTTRRGELLASKAPAAHAPTEGDTPRKLR